MRPKVPTFSPSGPHRLFAAKVYVHLHFTLALLCVSTYSSFFFLCGSVFAFAQGFCPLRQLLAAIFPLFFDHFKLLLGFPLYFIGVFFVLGFACSYLCGGSSWVLRLVLRVFMLPMLVFHLGWMWPSWRLVSVSVLFPRLLSRLLWLFISAACWLRSFSDSSLLFVIID